jgi:hypothetical protein
MDSGRSPAVANEAAYNFWVDDSTP